MTPKVTRPARAVGHRPHHAPQGGVAARPAGARTGTGRRPRSAPPRARRRAEQSGVRRREPGPTERRAGRRAGRRRRGVNRPASGAASASAPSGFASAARIRGRRVLRSRAVASPVGGASVGCTSGERRDRRARCPPRVRRPPVGRAGRLSDPVDAPGGRDRSGGPGRIQHRRSGQPSMPGGRSAGAPSAGIPGGAVARAGGGAGGIPASVASRPSAGKNGHPQGVAAIVARTSGGPGQRRAKPEDAAHPGEPGRPPAARARERLNW